MPFDLKKDDLTFPKPRNRVWTGKEADYNEPLAGKARGNYIYKSNEDSAKGEGDRASEPLIHPNFPSQGKAKPSYQGSQSASPGKAEGDTEESAPYLTRKEGWSNE